MKSKPSFRQQPMPIGWAAPGLYRKQSIFYATECEFPNTTVKWRFSWKFEKKIQTEAVRKSDWSSWRTRSYKISAIGHTEGLRNG